MAGFGEKIKKGWKEVRGNLAVELAKWIGGSTVIGAIFKAISQAAHRVPVDWMLFACLLVVGLLLVVFSIYRRGEQQEQEGRPAAAFTPPPAASPEDELEADRQRREKSQLESDLWRAQESRRMCDEERREVLRELKELKLVLSPVQLESLQLAKELRDLNADLGPYPDGVLDPNETDPARAAEAMAANFRREMKWQQRFLAAYADSDVAKRITSLMNRLGRQYDDFSIWPPDYSPEKIKPSKNALPGMAQRLEMIVIWINRRERNEVHLLGCAHEAPIS